MEHNENGEWRLSPFVWWFSFSVKTFPWNYGMSRENLVDQIIYTQTASTTAAHLLHGLRWQETQKTESCQLLKVYGIIILCYVIIKTTHVQAAAHERTTIIVLLYWNKVKNIFYLHFTSPENTSAIRISVVLQRLYAI